MEKMGYLWEALEAPFGVGGVRAELARILRDDLPIAEQFLRRLSEPSATYPCEQLGWDGCPRKIVVHSDSRIVAACGNDPPECETVLLQPQDIVRYEIDIAQLCRVLAQKLRFTPTAEKLTGRSDTWDAGFLAADGIARVSVWLVLPPSRADLRSAIDHLLASFGGSFVVLVPTLRWVDTAAEESLKRKQARLVSLQDAILVSNGKLRASRDLRQLVQSPVLQDTVPSVTKTRYRAPRSIGSESAVRAIRAYIKARGWNITEFGTQCNIGERTLYKFFRTHEIRRSDFKAMADHIGVAVEELLRGELPAKFSR